MDRALLGRPLQHALIALWVAGLAQLVVAAARSAPALGWAVSAVLAALVALCVAERLRRVEILPAAVLLGAGGILSGASVFGLTEPLVRLTLLAVCALGLWQLTVFMASLAGTQRLLSALKPSADGGWPRANMAEPLIHATCMALLAFAFGVSSLVSTVAGAGPVHLPVLTVSLVFMWLTVARYRRAWQAHTFVALCALATVAVYLQLTALPAQPADMPAAQVAASVSDPFAFVLDAGVALVLSLFALLAWIVTRVLLRTTAQTDDAPHGLAALHAQALEHGAIAIALLAVAQVVLITIIGSFDAPGWIAAAALSVAALALLGANHHALRPAIAALGVFIGLFGAIWLESASLHGAAPLALYPSGPASAEQWMGLGVLGAAAAWLGARLHLSPVFYQYANALRVGAIAIGLWVFAGTVVLLLQPAQPAPGTAGVMAGAFALLMFGALAPMQQIRHFGTLRSVAVVVLASCVWAVFIGPSTLGRLVWPLLAVWAFVLWAMAQGALQLFNRRWPRSAIEPAGFIWSGLVLVVIAAVYGLIRTTTDFDVFACLLALAAYAFLMTRHSGWRGFEVSSATLLVAAGWAVSVVRHLAAVLAADLTAIGMLAVETLSWANGVLLAVWIWSRYRERFCKRFAWRAPAMRVSVFAWVFGLCTLWIVTCAAWQAGQWLDPAAWRSGPQVPVWLTILFALTVTHVYLHVRHALVAHLLLLSLLLVANALWWSILSTGLSIMFACCSLLLAYFLASRGAPGEFTKPLRSAAAQWLPALAIGAVALAIAVPGSSDVDRALTVAIVTVVAGWHGFRHDDRFWLYGCAFGIVALVHLVWPVWQPGTTYFARLAWLVLEMAILAWLAERWARTGWPVSGGEVGHVLSEVWPWIAALALIEWVVHLGATFFGLQANAVGGEFGTVPSHTAAVAGSLVLVWLCVRRVAQSGVDGWMYLAAAIVGSAMVYIRLIAFGLSPPGAADTAAIIGSGYVLFWLHRVFGSRALWHMTMIVPLFALATVPFQLGSVHTAFALVAMGALYLHARRSSGAGTPLYLGLLAINAGLYLWVPQWSAQIGLVQLYAFPAALTVLWLLHVHRHELKPAVLSSARLAALVTLYVAAGADVFIQDSIAVFALALALSIAGIAVGIGLRVRAFLYAGVAFLVLNVIGQLLTFYPEHRLARAAILMGVGISITGMMVWFSLKREQVLERVRLVRSDLADWA